MQNYFLLVGLFFVSLVVGQVLAETEAEGRSKTLVGSDSVRIIGGRKAKAGEFPYQLFMTIEIGAMQMYRCGAIIINRRWALTAAHCFNGVPTRNPVNLYAGYLNKNNPEKKKAYRVSKILIHESYRADKTNDIALMKVERGFEFSDHVSYIKLHERTSDLVNEMAVVSGWGSTVTSGEGWSDDLLAANVTILDYSYCKKVYRSFNKEIQICAGHWTWDSGKDSCTGDSGGPLVVNKRLVGIVSHGGKNSEERCGVKGYPGVYTRVSAFRRWIFKTIDNN